MTLNHLFADQNQTHEIFDVNSIKVAEIKVIFESDEGKNHTTFIFINVESEGKIDFIGNAKKLNISYFV